MEKSNLTAIENRVIDAVDLPEPHNPAVGNDTTLAATGLAAIDNLNEDKNAERDQRHRSIGFPRYRAYRCFSYTYICAAD